MVYEALVWLKANNPYYSAIEIDMGRIQDLPEDDVMDEMLAAAITVEGANNADRQGYDPLRNVCLTVVFNFS